MKRLIVLMSVLLLLSACGPTEEKKEEISIDSRVYEDTYFPNQRDSLIELTRELDKYDLILIGKVAVFGFELAEGEFLVLQTSPVRVKEETPESFIVSWIFKAKAGVRLKDSINSYHLAELFNTLAKTKISQELIIDFLESESGFLEVDSANYSKYVNYLAGDQTVVSVKVNGDLNQDNKFSLVEMSDGEIRLILQGSKAEPIETLREQIGRVIPTINKLQLPMINFMVYEDYCLVLDATSAIEITFFDYFADKNSDFPGSDCEINIFYHKKFTSSAKVKTIVDTALFTKIIKRLSPIEVTEKQVVAITTSEVDYWWGYTGQVYLSYHLDKESESEELQFRYYPTVSK